MDALLVTKDIKQINYYYYKYFTTQIYDDWLFEYSIDGYFY